MEFSPGDDENGPKIYEMKVVGTSSRGTITTDTFSLMGFSKAYQNKRSLKKIKI